MTRENAPITIDTFIAELQEELQQARTTQKEVALMLTQSQSELNKLAQRNAKANSDLQQVQAQIDSLPRHEIKAVYNDALDAQQRLLVMRGQLEKLQNDDNDLRRLIKWLERSEEFFTQLRPPAEDETTPENDRSTTLELMINAQEAERQRLSRQMHDGPAQALSNFIVQAEIASRLFDLDHAKAKEELNALRSNALHTFQKVRAFISDLRPMALDDLGVVAALRKHIETFREETGLEVQLNTRGMEERQESYIEVLIYRSVQELLANAARHNRDFPGKVIVTVQLVREDHLIRVQVADNGKGFDTTAVKSGLGLNLIRERVEMLDGDFRIESTPGMGTRISFQLPLEG